MAENLDVSQSLIEVDKETNEFKATPYFEEFLFQLVHSLGGENSSDTTDGFDLINLHQTLVSTPSKISQLKRQLKELEQLNENQALVSVPSKLSKLKSDTVENFDLANMHQTLVSMPPKISELRKDAEEVEQLLSSVIAEHGYIRQILSKILSFKVIELKAADTTHTTQGNEIIICNNTASATITLNAAPKDKEEIYIVKKVGAINFISTAGINGSTSAIPILGQFGAPHLIYTNIANEYSII